ncbi:alpha/beta fold hydrolase [Arcanobacterium haemolyticum]|nr:alpha/beta fold hydrolase [Arcanobacterium haemolyticum]
MALEEVMYPSFNQRDTIYGWIWSPVSKPRAIVHIVHGLGEHCRRYSHLIQTLLDAGIIVCANDHIGHGKTAMESGIWVDTGSTGHLTYPEDERSLQKIVTERYPGVPYVVFGHSWGSIIARQFAERYSQTLAGLILGGIAAKWDGLSEAIDADALAASIAQQEDILASEEDVAALFRGFNDRYDEGVATAWVARSSDVVKDHARDPLNNFGAPMTARFLRDLLDAYRQVDREEWPTQIPSGLGVLIVAGDQDPVCGFGEGAYAVANSLWRTGHSDVRTRVYSGLRHEVHNEPESRADVEAEILAFVEKHL